MLKAGRAHGFTDPYILPEHPVGPLPRPPSDLSYSLDAIVGADGAASDGVPLTDVFQNHVKTTRDRTPTCMSSFSLLNTFGLTRDFQSVRCGSLVSDTPLTSSCIR
jgi:hypothetical protein